MSVLDQFSLSGSRALVTGASRGLGAAMALGLAEAGADVVCASSSPERRRRQRRRRSARLVDKAWTVHGDLADADERNAMADAAERAAGTIDILVNNGGTIARHPAESYPEAEWDRVLQTNLDAVFFLSQWFGRG